MKLLFFLFSCTIFGYECSGKHFFATYIDCDPESLQDRFAVERVMGDAVRSSRANILDCTVHHFGVGGVTILYLLSESHASIHTYPEHNACFVDLFTCGDKCSHEMFDKILRDHFKPKSVNWELLYRDNKRTCKSFLETYNQNKQLTEVYHGWTRHK